MDTIRVCSFTGGGASGAMQAVMADIIEQRTGRAFAKNFHIMAGTSVGALTVLPLALKRDGTPFRTAAELVDYWPTAAKKILKVDFLRAVRSRMGRRFPALAPDGRLEAIDAVLGGYNLSDLASDVIVMGHNIENARAHIFFSTYARGDFPSRTPAEWIKNPRFYDYNLTDVAMATTALPGAFESHSLSNMLGTTYRIADGAITKNNLINICARAANNFYGRDIDITGTIFGTGVIPVQPLANEGLNEWTRRISDAYTHHISGAELIEATLDPCLVHLFNLDTMIEQKAEHLPKPKIDRIDGSPQQIAAIIENTRYAATHEKALQYNLDQLCEILQDPPVERSYNLNARSDRPCNGVTSRVAYGPAPAL